jgi:hypothetical protein
MDLRSVFLVMCAAASLGGCATTASDLDTKTVSSAHPESSEIIPREVLVKFHPAVTQNRIRQLTDEMGLELLRHFDSLQIYHFRIASDRPTDEVIQWLLQLPEVEYAETNVRRKLDGHTC